MIAAGILSLLPLVWVGFYNHMSGDDWYNARFVSQMVLHVYRIFFCYLMSAGFGKRSFHAKEVRKGGNGIA